MIRLTALALLAGALLVPVAARADTLSDVLAWLGITRPAGPVGGAHTDDGGPGVGTGVVD